MNSLYHTKNEMMEPLLGPRLWKVCLFYFLYVNQAPICLDPHQK